jgi:hypothetical protein
MTATAEQRIDFFRGLAASGRSPDIADASDVYRSCLRFAHRRTPREIRDLGYGIGAAGAAWALAHKGCVEGGRIDWRPRTGVTTAWRCW